MPVDPSSFTPSPEQVSSLLVARGGPFTDQTVPTRTQVAQQCDDVAAELASELRVLPDVLVGLATSVVKYKVAADVEAGTWPEQQAGAGGSGPIWYLRYTEAHDRLIQLAADYGDGTAKTASIPTPSPTLLAARRIAAGQADPNPDVSSLSDEFTYW